MLARFWSFRLRVDTMIVMAGDSTQNMPRTHASAPVVPECRLPLQVPVVCPPRPRSIHPSPSLEMLPLISFTTSVFGQPKELLRASRRTGDYQVHWEGNNQVFRQKRNISAFLCRTGGETVDQTISEVSLFPTQSPPCLQRTQGEENPHNSLHPSFSSQKKERKARCHPIPPGLISLSLVLLGLCQARGGLHRGKRSQQQQAKLAQKNRAQMGPVKSCNVPDFIYLRRLMMCNACFFLTAVYLCMMLYGFASLYLAMASSMSDWISCRLSISNPGPGASSHPFSGSFWQRLRVRCHKAARRSSHQSWTGRRDMGRHHLHMEEVPSRHFKHISTGGLRRPSSEALMQNYSGLSCPFKRAEANLQGCPEWRVPETKSGT